MLEIAPYETVMVQMSVLQFCVSESSSTLLIRCDWRKRLQGMNLCVMFCVYYSLCIMKHFLSKVCFFFLCNVLYILSNNLWVMGNWNFVSEVCDLVEAEKLSERLLLWTFVGLFCGFSGLYSFWFNQPSKVWPAVGFSACICNSA